MKLPWVRIAPGRPETEIVIAGVRLTATPRQIERLPMVSALVAEGVLVFVQMTPTPETSGPIGNNRRTKRHTTMEG